MLTSRSAPRRRTTGKVSRTGVQQQEMSGAHRTGASKEPDAAKRRLQQIGRATAKLARHSMKEMTAAVKDCREPMKSLWRSVARAGRNIARDATVAWREMTPARVEKRAVVGKSRRSAA